MGNTLSNRRDQNEKPTSVPVPDSPSRPATTRRVLGVEMVRFECSSDSNKRTETTNKSTHAVVRKSQSVNKSRGSFLDLAAEHRNYIYAQVLIHSGDDHHIRVTHDSPTRIPELNLLRVCKQVHDEASSFFYSANSFYCNVDLRIHVLNKTKFQLQEGDIRRRWFQREDRDLQLHEGDLGAWGVLFPAPQYHRWVTRVTIDANILLATTDIERKNGYFSRDDCERSKMYGVEWKYGNGQTREPAHVAKSREQTVAKMNEQVRDLFIGTYRNMRTLWEEKPEERSWEGRLVIAQDEAYPKRIQFSVSFYEGEEEERLARVKLRRTEE